MKNLEIKKEILVSATLEEVLKDIRSHDLGLLTSIISGDDFIQMNNLTENETEDNNLVVCEFDTEEELDAYLEQDSLETSDIEICSSCKQEIYPNDECYGEEILCDGCSIQCDTCGNYFSETQIIKGEGYYICKSCLEKDTITNNAYLESKVSQLCSDGEVNFEHNNHLVNIFVNSNGDYEYNIYELGIDAMEMLQVKDGGFCLGTPRDAICTAIEELKHENMSEKLS